MQILIGFGIAVCGIMVGFILKGIITEGKIEELAKVIARQFIGEYMELLDKTEKGELTQEYLDNYLERTLLWDILLFYY